MKLPLLTASLILISVRLFAWADTTHTSQHFTKTQLNDDVTFLVKAVESVHPYMYHSISKSDYQKLTDSVRRVLHDGMTDRQAWPAMARLVGALGEGHSTFNEPDSLVSYLKAGERVLFPVIIKEFNGKNLIVRGDLSSENMLLPGDEITAINGIKVPKLVDELSSNTGGLKMYRSIDVCRNIVSYLALYHINAPYRISYLRNGKSEKAALNAITWPEFRANAKTRGKTFLAAANYPQQSLSYLDVRTAYMAINSLSAKPETFEVFLDSCFNQLQQKPAQKLVIDLRRNAGGNSRLGKMLLGYITNQPFRMTGGVRWKISQEYKNKIIQEAGGKAPEDWGYYLNAANGTMLTDTSIAIKAPESNPLQYKGRVYVLIGPHTFSSANMLANTIQDYHLATLVGEPSGEPANDYGEIITLKLPNTGFRFTTSSKQFIRANGNTKDNNPVLPQLRIADNPVTPQDEVLEFVKCLP